MGYDIKTRWFLGEPVLMTDPQFMELPCLETDSTSLFDIFYSAILIHEQKNDVEIDCCLPIVF